jgi:hypothetical protein
MATIRFKSTQSNWRKEYSGLKPNTLRTFDQKENDIRQELLDKFIKGNLNILRIEMDNVDTGESFARMVTDVTEWKGTYIISWRHN